MNTLRTFAVSSPRRAVLAASGLLVFLAIAAIVLIVSGGEDPITSAVAPSASRTPEPLPTATVEPTVEPTPVPNRADCQAILGTPYLSDEEGAWFAANCAHLDGPAVAAGTGNTQVPIGDRLVIPAAGVNTPVWRVTVPLSGQMPDPVGYFNAVWYDFSRFPGLGGYTNTGNMVMAGHVDCARCNNGGPSRAVFYGIRALSVGDTARYETADGRVIQYVVTLSQSFSPNAVWEPIVASAAADMTLITCTGTFSGGDYNLRHVVAFKKAS